MTEDRRAVPLSKPPETAANGSGFGHAPAADGAVDPNALEAQGSTASTPPPGAARDGAPSMARRRLSLRIPDDEIGRPKRAAPDATARGAIASPPPPRPSPLPEPGPSSEASSFAPLTPMRIITINADPAMAREPAVPPEPARPPEPAVPPEPPTEPTLARDDSPRPSSPDVAVDSESSVLTPRAPLPLEADEVEVRFEDEATPAIPRVVALQDERERRSDPPPEVAAEDVVMVEAPSAPPPSLGPAASARAVAASGSAPAQARGRGRPAPAACHRPPARRQPPQASEAPGSRRKSRPGGRICSTTTMCARAKRSPRSTLRVKFTSSRRASASNAEARFSISRAVPGVTPSSSRAAATRWSGSICPSRCWRERGKTRRSVRPSSISSRATCAKWPSTSSSTAFTAGTPASGTSKRTRTRR